MHINGESCGGLGDLYYVTAVSIKRLVDERNNSVQYSTAMFTAHTTLLTLLFDSGLNDMAETHLSKAFKINPSDSSLKMRSALMTPAIFKTIDDLKVTRRLLETRIDSLLADTNFTLATLDEFVLSPTFYFAYQGFNDREILSKLRAVYVAAYRDMSVALIDQQHFRVHSSSLLNAKIKIGFISSYFRRHSVCKLFCGVIAGLDREKFEVFLFSSMAENDADSFTAMVSKGATFLRVGKTLVGNRHIVTSRNIDVLVYLDIGMEPSTVVWAAARLAPVQVALWGHPSTSGTDNIDYFLSSDDFHASAASLELPQDHFVEQLVRLDSLGFYFDRPILKGWKKEIETRGLPESYYDESLVNRSEALFDYLTSSLTNPRLRELAMMKKTSQVALILCPQHLPKFHPDVFITLIFYSTILILHC
jgi:protein O-GlcNAc transferase